MRCAPMALEPISPIDPPAPYLGGKSGLAAVITPLLDRTDHHTYAEPFVGLGGVFFRRSRRPKLEVVNDRGREVATFFRILQRHYPQFLETLRFQVTTRAEFERLKACDPATLTDLERAARFLYLQRTAFGGKPTGQTFGVAPDRGARFDLTRLTPMLEDVHSRLSGVVIECLDFADFIARYDGPGTLFYCDPPYDGSEGFYGKGLFGPDDFERLAVALGAIEGRFVLSINDTPRMRAIFSGHDVRSVETRYSVAQKRDGALRDAELLITKGVDLAPPQGALL